MAFVLEDEEWVAAQLARELEQCAREDTEAAWQDVAKRFDVPILRIRVPGAAPACYVPELFYPCTEPRGLIVLNMTCPVHQRGRAIRHEIGHHLLWPCSVNQVFGRRFPLDPAMEAFLLRERIVQRAEQLCSQH